ncbi:hypothetical protein QVD17_39414 [Tagetes erecta]|uniref:Uncharacterized protein n=1 Tax=Tagetes erecta TaxID=13708 RepID=A0AAD8JS84_TARER|nr:hypothetical protein QVD17_39414 [Tagetes erecta]
MVSKITFSFHFISFSNFQFSKLGRAGDRMMEEQGTTIEDITNCLELDPQIISAIRSAHTHGCDLKLLSDANHFFIQTILKNHGIYDCFSDIITNPTFVDQQARLRILPYHGSAHGCDLCPPNLS